jgi:HK97 family phage portal protein
MPFGMSIKKRPDGTVESFKRNTDNNLIIAEDMCQFKYVNPNDYYFGQSPLQAAGKAVDVDNAAQEWQKVSMQNRGVPDYAVSFESDLTPDQYGQARDVIKAQSGTGSAREPIIMSKAKIQQLSQSPVEMDFMNTRRFSREEVSSVYGVPSALYAEMNEANLSNAETARKVFWLDTILPLMDELKDTLNACLIPDFAANGERIRIVYDTANVAALQVNMAEKITNANKLWAMGVPFNTINSRMELGFDDVEGGDVGYIASSAIPTNFDFNEGTTEQQKAVYDELLKKSLNAN